MPKLTDPGEMDIIRKIYFEKKELTDEQDKAEKKAKKIVNQAR